MKSPNITIFGKMFKGKMFYYKTNPKHIHRNKSYMYIYKTNLQKELSQSTFYENTEDKIYSKYIMLKHAATYLKNPEK